MFAYFGNKRKSLQENAGFTKAHELQLYDRANKKSKQLWMNNSLSNAWKSLWCKTRSNKKHWKPFKTIDNQKCSGNGKHPARRNLPPPPYH